MIRSPFVPQCMGPVLSRAVGSNLDLCQQSRSLRTAYLHHQTSNFEQACTGLFVSSACATALARLILCGRVCDGRGSTVAPCHGFGGLCPAHPPQSCQGHRIVPQRPPPPLGWRPE
jgi:hypothetical protein